MRSLVAAEQPFAGRAELLHDGIAVAQQEEERDQREGEDDRAIEQRRCR